MDGDKVPFVWIPGYELLAPGVKPWKCVPYLGFQYGPRKLQLKRDVRKLQLNYLWSSHCSPSWAVPAFFRE